MDNLGVKNVTNIDTEDFEGMYFGQAISFRRGQTKAFPEECAKHLAGQLATKILQRKGKDYLDDPERAVLLGQILGDFIVLSEEPIIPEEKIEPKEEPKEEFADLEAKKPKKTKK